MNDDEQFFNTSHTIEGLSGMRDFASRLAALLRGRGVVLALHGDLGAGKTTFVQFLAAAMGVTRPVTSLSNAFVRWMLYATESMKSME